MATGKPERPPAPRKAQSVPAHLADSVSTISVSIRPLQPQLLR